jgi:hypothetical protein
MRAARRFRLRLSIVSGLFAFVCLLPGSSAIADAASVSTPPYLDPAYASRLLALVQDTSEWSSAENEANNTVQGVL